MKEGSGLSKSERSQAAKGPQPQGPVKNHLRRSRRFSIEKQIRLFVASFFNLQRARSELFQRKIREDFANIHPSQ